MRIVSVVGARPQFVKLAPIAHAMHGRAEHLVVHTGQHYDEAMSEVFFRDLGIPAPDLNLGVGSGPHGRQTGTMLAGLETAFERLRPDWVLVYGDTNSTLAAALAAQRPLLRVLATDQSAVAVASARATIDANALAERVTVVRADGLSGQADDSADLILLNPPFHIGASVHAGLAEKLFIDAARVLAPGGELWTVWNTHLGYRPMLTRIVGSTRQVGRNTKFTVTVSTGR